MKEEFFKELPVLRWILPSECEVELDCRPLDIIYVRGPHPILWEEELPSPYYLGGCI